MRVWVTGSAGFVGQHLLRRLARGGHEVIEARDDLDVADAPAVDARLAQLRPDAVVHLAALSSVALSWREPALTYRTNYLGTRAVLDSVARHAPTARVLLVTSADIYGPLPPGGAPFSEAAPLRPHSPYGRSKAAADLLGARRAADGLAVLRVRPSNHSGPGQSPDFVLASFARQLAEIEAGRREPRLEVGNLDAERDFLDVSDVVDAYARLLEQPAPAAAYNVASGQRRRIGELLDELIAASRARPEIVVDPERVRPADALVLDASRLRQATGWEPRTSTAAMLAALLEASRAELAAS